MLENLEIKYKGGRFLHFFELMETQSYTKLGDSPPLNLSIINVCVYIYSKHINVMGSECIAGVSRESAS